MGNKEAAYYLETISNSIIAIVLFLFPIFFLPITTDFFIIPKQVLIVASVCLLLIIWGLKIIAERKITLNINTLNIPVLFFTAVVIVSSVLSQNRFDSLIQTVPTIAAIVLFFVIINNVREERAFSLILSAYLLGAAASVLISVAYYFQIYIFPIPQIQDKFFNTFGSVLQQLIYLIPAFIFFILYTAKKVNFPKIRISSENAKVGFFVQAGAGLVIFAGILFLAFEIIFLPNKPIILPYIYGFQTAFATISQDTQRFILSLLFGSGYGTFLVDFTRFRLPAFNLEQGIWNLSFAYSSTYFLELIATTGVLGGLSYLLIAVGMIRSASAKNPLFIALFAIFVLSFILPFSFTSVVALFVLAGIFLSFLNIAGDKRVYDVSLAIVTSKSGNLSFAATPEDEHLRGKKESPILSAIVFILILIIVGATSFYTYKFFASDRAFAASIKAAAQNNGQKTYELQTQAINSFPYRSDYQRIFSQVNLSLANSLSQSIPEGASPSAEVQQNIIGLLQQSINSARNAVIISPLTSINWQNLSQIYRSLINSGQNADQFAISSANQAIALDPYNPALYVAVGGIYYQLGQYDQAQSQFQVAINLKRDFANAYYNLGHALEAKGDLESALAAYQTVKQLSANDKTNSDKINEEIQAITARIGTAKTTTGAAVTAETEQTPLELSTDEAQLPGQTPSISITPPPPPADEASQSAE